MWLPSWRKISPVPALVGKSMMGWAWVGGRWGEVRPGWVNGEVVARSTALRGPVGCALPAPPKVGGIFGKAQVQTDMTHGGPTGG